MFVWIATALFIVFVVLLVPLFRKTRQVMRERDDTMNRALTQLVNYRDGVNWARSGREEAEILARCEDVYLQSVKIHNCMMRKVWSFLPAFLMGHRLISDEEAKRRLREE